MNSTHRRLRLAIPALLLVIAAVTLLLVLRRKEADEVAPGQAVVEGHTKEPATDLRLAPPTITAAVSSDQEASLAIAEDGAPETPPEVAATRRMYLAHAPLRAPEVADPDSEANRRVLEAMVVKALARAREQGAATPSPAAPQP